MKNQNTFKVGDLVYIPSHSTQVHPLKETPPSHQYEGNPYPLCVIDDYQDIWRTFSEQGYCDRTDNLPELIHATQEKYELLSKLYPNVSFEPPPKRKEPKEIIKAMLESGWVGVACYVNDIDKRPSKNNKKDFIVLVKDDSFEYIYSGNYCNWKYANPFDPKTGKTIIDFVDGEVVLESENE